MVLFISGATFTGSSEEMLEHFIELSVMPIITFGPNTVTVTLTVTDSGGNVSTDTITHTITRVDDESPTVSAMTQMHPEILLH